MKPLVVDEADADEVASRRRLSEDNDAELPPLTPALSLSSLPLLSSGTIA
jgi:hypothetical protein